MDEERLRALFERRGSRANAPMPGVTAILARRRPRPRPRLRRSLVAATAGLAILALATRLGTRPDTEDPLAMAAEIMSWQSTTDVLLDPALGQLPVPEEEGVQ